MPFTRDPNAPYFNGKAANLLPFLIRVYQLGTEHNLSDASLIKYTMKYANQEDRELWSYLPESEEDNFQAFAMAMVTEFYPELSPSNVPRFAAHTPKEPEAVFITSPVSPISEPEEVLVVDPVNPAALGSIISNDISPSCIDPIEEEEVLPSSEEISLAPSHFPSSHAPTDRFPTLSEPSDDRNIPGPLPASFPSISLLLSPFSHSRLSRTMSLSRRSHPKSSYPSLLASKLVKIIEFSSHQEILSCSKVFLDFHYHSTRTHSQSEDFSRAPMPFPIFPRSHCIGLLCPACYTTSDYFSVHHTTRNSSKRALASSVRRDIGRDTGIRDDEGSRTLPKPLFISFSRKKIKTLKRTQSLFYFSFLSTLALGQRAFSHFPRNIPLPLHTTSHIRKNAPDLRLD